MPLLQASRRVLVGFSLLLTLIAMGALLVASAWSNRREAREVSALLDQGESERFMKRIIEIHDREHRPATQEELAAVLAWGDTDGLRYVGLFDHGTLVAEAGQRQGEVPQELARGPKLERVGPVLRSVLHAPPGPHGPPDHPAGQPGPPGEAPGPPELAREPPGPPPHHAEDRMHGRPFPTVVIEFLPTVSDRLRERATRGFVFATVVATALIALALGLFALLMREERRREQNERERSLTALGAMSAVLAHEIRNPLASLKGHAQLLAEKLEPESPHGKKVARIVSEAQRLEELTATLLDLVRSSSVSRHPLDPRALLDEAAIAVGESHIQIDAESLPATFSLDATRMGQVLRNLFENARLASPEGARVEVSASVERGVLVVRVRDHGNGLAKGAEDHLFEPFHTTRAQGTGLGLAVARRIVELHGGELTGDTHPSGGAEFVLRIPG